MQLRATKINGAAWLPAIAEHIEHLCKRAHVDGIQPGNLQTYLAQVAQGWFGKNANELWMVFEGDYEKPVAFASWHVLGLPHIAKVSCFVIHSWSNNPKKQRSGNPKAVDMLCDEFIKFGEKWNAVWWAADFVGEANVRLFTKKMADRGFVVKRSNLINVVSRRA